MNSSAAVLDREDRCHRQLQSVFTRYNWDIRKAITIDVTARNDWASTLAFTKHEEERLFILRSVLLLFSTMDGLTRMGSLLENCVGHTVRWE